MQLVLVLVVLGILWGLGAIIGSISDYFADSERKRIAEVKEREHQEQEKKRHEAREAERAEQERFDAYKKIKLAEHQEKVAAWHKIVVGELESLRRKNEIEHEQKILVIETKNKEILAKWDAQKKELHEAWVASKREARKQHGEHQKTIEKIKGDYIAGNPKSITNYCEIVLASQPLPREFPRQHELEYVVETKTLVCNFVLPAPSDIPTLKEVKFIKTKAQLKQVHLSQSAINKLYDDVIYQITLGTLALLFKADEASAIDSINFNGWVNSTDKGTGHEVKACIVSVFTSKKDVAAINLKNVEPKECFKRLKGVGSSQLYGITPIPPIMKINSQDKRFVESYEVAQKLDESMNLAAMDWEDFEHLVREIFEKKFSRDGFEVKVTQSSRDKGVDAIAFDPDPLRGGKIVIQAKRYTNVVGVSAVRDLYGTVMNEGANKGILVTTSNFGSDAYEFVKNKPLTLISGGELLTLLLDAGYKARINLKEAKRMLAEQKAE
jgi:restriction system protein